MPTPAVADRSCSPASISCPWLHHHLSFDAYRRFDHFIGHIFAEQHLVMGLARWYHREAIGEIGHAAIEDHRTLDGDHLVDGAVEIGRLHAPYADAAIGFSELHEIGQRVHVAFGNAIAVQELLPLAHHAHILIVQNIDLHG